MDKLSMPDIVRYPHYEYMEMVEYQTPEARITERSWNPETQRVEEKPVESDNILLMLTTYSRLGYRLCGVIPGHDATRYCFQRETG